MDKIAKKIEQEFYDLGNEACGIKQGVNRQSQIQNHLLSYFYFFKFYIKISIINNYFLSIIILILKDFF